MNFESILPKKDINIEEIYTVHYFEYMSDFNFPGERHDFWEFQYIDKGQAEIYADDTPHTLSQGQAIFHRPNEFHNLRAAAHTAPNIIVVSFTCHSPAMKFFEKKILTLSEEERSMLGMLVAETRHCIASPLDDPSTRKMELSSQPLTGSRQLMFGYLELLLIHMIRRYFAPQAQLPIDPARSARRHEVTYHTVLQYLEEHIRESVSIEKICHDNLIGRSQLHKLFNERHQCGVIDYFSQMKISMARQLIREQQMNFTQISDFLGYSSVHYFSRQFKKITGMTPTEYAFSVKAKSEQ